MAAVLKTLQEKLEHTAVDYRNCRKGAPPGLRLTGRVGRLPQFCQSVMPAGAPLPEER
jgi:hypothetical protein